jgi:hypothetical protein
MRTLLAVVVLVSLEAVGHAQATISIGPQGTISIGPQGQYLGNGPQGNAPQGQYPGDLSASRIDPDSGPNRFGRFGSRFGPDSINNPYGQWGSPYSTNSMTNPSTTRGPRAMQPNQPTMPPGW